MIIIYIINLYIFNYLVLNCAGFSKIGFSNVGFPSVGFSTSGSSPCGYGTAMFIGRLCSMSAYTQSREICNAFGAKSRCAAMTFLLTFDFGI